MTDADAAEWCATLGCKGDPVDDEEYCAECVDTSPKVVDDPDAAGEAVNPAGRSVGTTETPETPKESAAEGQTTGANPGKKTDKPTSLAAATFDPLDDPEFDASTAAVREHYRRAGPILDALESVDGFPTSAFAGNSGWYRYTDAGDLDREAFDAGFRSFRRAYTIERDREELLDAIEADPDEDSWRSLYAITSYKDPEAIYGGAYSKDRRGGFDGGEGLPDYADIRALPLWIDVDLADDRDDALDPDDETEYGADLKARRGDLDPRELRVVERALGLIVAEVADVYDLPPEAIAAFDSGGGSYPFGPAAATLPIAERYDDPETRERLFDELADRMNAYVAGDEDTAGTVDAYGFEGIVPRVEERVPGAKYLLDADALLNKNRQTKAPGSIHKSHDVVVTPLRDTDGEVDYSPTTVSEFAENDDLRERTAAETRKFTENTPEARACVEPLVATLFPEYAPEGREDVADWHDALDAWLADDWRRERARIHASARDDLRRRERREERREELADELDREPTEAEVSEALADQQVTTVRQDVFDDLDRIDTEEIIRTYAADEWNTSNRGHETTFDPSWRSSGSGKSCAVPNGGDTFIDNSCNGGGGPAKAYALGAGILPGRDTAAATPLRGRKWGEAVDGLRREGYDIRVYVPEAGEEYDETPLWALRKAAVALDVCAPDEFVEHETEGGETYPGFDRETFNATLDALDEAGVDHGREHIDAGQGEAGGRESFDVEPCRAPVYDPVAVDTQQRRDQLEGERLDDWLDREAGVLEIFGDEAGDGKTTSTGRGLAARDRAFVTLLPSHENCREYELDDAKPDVDHHHKGAAQPYHDCCMDAKVAADEGETPYCIEHGHPADWERMCPIYHLDTDHPIRRRYEALVSEIGVEGAHEALDLDEYDWHGKRCHWQESYDQLEDAERVVTVHNYLTQKTVRGVGDVILDDVQGIDSFTRERQFTVEGLTRAANRLDRLAGIEGTPGALGEFARFAHNLVDALTGGYDDKGATQTPNIEALDPPELPEDYKGWKGEPLAQAKLEYNEAVVRDMKNDEWGGEPLCIDALLAAGVEAGLDRAPAMVAAALPATLDSCPRCETRLEWHGGAAGCPACGWDERSDPLTKPYDETARSQAWLDRDGEHREDGQTCLAFRALPLRGDLPEPHRTLWLDATPTPELAALLFGLDTGNVVVTGDEPRELNAQVTQITNGQYHRGTIARGTREGDDHNEYGERLRGRFQTLIEERCRTCEQVLVAGHKKNRHLFDLPENAEWMHYHAGRGLDRSGYDAVVVVGAPHVREGALRRDAELLAQGRDAARVGGREFGTRRNEQGELDANPPLYRKYHYEDEDEDGRGRAAPTKGYSGMMGTLFRASREDELHQIGHRIRPGQADEDEPKHIDLLTNVPTDLPVDHLTDLETLTDPLYEQAGLTEGAMDMQAAALDAVDRLENGQPIAGVRPGMLVETDENGDLAMKAEAWRYLCRVYGVETRNGTTPSLGTIYDWLERLDALDLLHPEEYEQREGRTHSGSPATLNLALQYLSHNVNFKVDVARRFHSLVADGADAETWLDLLAEAFDAGDGVSGGHPPPDPT